MTGPNPTTSSAGLAAALIAIAGPTAGEYLTIILASLIGAMWSLSGRAASSRLDGAWFLIRMCGTAIVFSSSLTWLVEKQFGWPAHHVLAGVAFFIAFVGDRWRGLRDTIVKRAQRHIGGDKDGE